jgi:PAS domain S-box-containing protein
MTLPTLTAPENAAAAEVQNRILDSVRLATLRRTSLLDSPAEAAYDRLTRLAVRLLHVPVALVSLVDADRQFFKSCVGLPAPWADARQTPLSHSFCQHVVMSGEPLLIEDSRTDPRVIGNLAITDLGVIAYAGIPLMTADGQSLGSFCAIDHEPRVWTAAEVETLKDLAASAITEIELRLAAAEAREQTLEAERERQEKLALLDSAAEGIYGIDGQGRCTFWNRAAAGMTRYDPEEVLGRNVHALIHHQRPDGSPYPEEECLIYQALRRNEGCRSDNEVLWRKDGTSFPAEYASSPIIEDGQIRGAVVSFANISRRKELEQLRDDLTHMIVHDLRTPLTSLLTGLQTVPLLGDMNDAQDEVLELAVQGGTTLLGMINDLLDIDKIEAGSLALEYADVSPGDLVASALSQVQPLARSKGLQLRQEVPDDLGPFSADEEKLRRVLVNLLGNAMKFTSEGGVTVGARRALGEEALIFFVRDTGEGIPREAFERIFEKFGQVDSRKGGRKMSTGLGLTFCKMAVEAHGGRIWVESEPGEGSTFQFTLPQRAFSP